MSSSESPPKLTLPNNKIITVHHLEHSQSFRIVWLLEELNLEYDLKLYKRTKDDSLAPMEYKQISSTGTSPVITISDKPSTSDKSEEEENKEQEGTPKEEEEQQKEEEGAAEATEPKETAEEQEKEKDSSTITLCESNAIVDYILDLVEDLEEYKSTKPEPLRIQKASTDLRQEDDRLRYLFWYHCIQGSLQSLVTIDQLFRLVPKKVPWPLSASFTAIVNKLKTTYIKPRMQTILNLAEEQLEASRKQSGNDESLLYFAGFAHMTTLDIVAIYTIEAILTRYPELLMCYPVLQDWLDQMYERPKFKLAQQKVDETYVVLSLT